MSQKDDYVLSYRVVEVYPDERLFVVRYLCDFMTEDELKSDPNVDENGVPVRCRTDYSLEIPLEHETISDEELEAMIWQNCPREFFEKLYRAKFYPEKIRIEIPIGKSSKMPVSKIDAELEEIAKKKSKQDALDSLNLSEEEWNILTGNQ